MPDTNDNQTTPITNNLVDDSQQPYGNRYDVAKRYSKVLFRPGRPAFSQELLEMESIQNNQLAMLGNTLFQEGAIISGMEIIPRPDNQSTSTGMPNLFSVSSLFANNAKINTDLYTNSGVFSIESSANLPNDVVGTNFSAIATKGLNMTISFGIKKRSGTLNRLNIDFDDDKLDVIEWTIDGEQVINNLEAISTPELLVDTDKNQINLNDGAEHKVIVKFRTQDSGSQQFNLVLNGGYDLTTTPVLVDINHMYIEDGLEASDTWQINPKDTGTPSSVDNVKNYMVKPGRIWLAGAVREFDGDNFSIKGVGKETIGLKVQERVITSNEDSDLLDDTPNSVTRGEAGADRVQYEVKLTENDPSSTPFVVFQDNVINPKAVKPDYSNLNPILAKRTYDQSGSFRTSGFEGHMRQNSDPSKGAQDPDDASKILLDIDAGQAYVRGYSISTSETKTLKLDTAESAGTSTNEGFYYRGDGSAYKLFNQPVKEVLNVTYTARQEGGPGTNQNHTAMPAGGDITHVKFTDQNVTYVRKVTSPENGGLYEYTEGKDFTCLNNEIHWGVDLSGKPLGNAQIPTAGQSFYVTYDYSVNATEKVDYNVAIDENNETSIQIIQGSPNTPVPGTTINVTYSYFQARIDMIRITMDQDNPFKVVPGTPAPLSSVTPPIVEDPYTLELGYVLIQPNSHNATFTLQTITRITFNDLQQWGIRLTNTEYNMGIAAMNEQVQRAEDPTYMKDAFSDDFNTIVNRDDATSTVAYDFENGEILLPSQAQADLKPNWSKDDSEIAMHVHSQLVTPPFTETEAVSQNLATGIVNVNEYDIFSANGTLEISPSSDSWTDTTNVVDYKTKQERPVELHKAWWHLDHPQWMDQTANYLNLQGINWQTPGAGETQTGYTLSDGGSQTTESEIQYMRSNTIKFTAQNFIPYSSGYTITIDGTPVQAMKADDPKYANETSDDGTVLSYKADGDGVIKGSFVIPGNTIRCGVRTVKVLDNSGDVATTNYTAQGTLKTVTQTIEKRIQDITIVDPLAQSFTLQEMRQIASVYLYFAKKPTGAKDGHRSDLIVQIRELSDDGYPSRTVRGETTLQPEQIETSSDGSNGTKVTFADSITLNANQGYAICLITDSDEYALYKASRGEQVINAGTNETIYDSNPDAIYNMDGTAQGQNISITRTVSANVGDTIKSAPNANGVMFTSNNAQTWTADPASSLKFVVNVCEYDKKGVVQFDPIVTAEFERDADQNWIKDKGPNLDGNSQTPKVALSAVDRLATLTSYLTYQNTSMNWYYRILSVDNTNSNGSLADPAQAILNQPWKPLIVNNDNTAQTQPGASEDNVPAITDSNDPQNIDGEINLFKNSVAFQLKADFNSDRYVAPVVSLEDLSLVAILTGKKATYESIDVDESGDAGFNEIKLQYDAYIPEVGSNIPNVNPMYSVDGGSTWYNFKKGSTNGDEDTVETSDSVDPENTYTTTDDGCSVPWASDVITNPKTVSAYFKRYTFRAKVPGPDPTKPEQIDANHLAHQFKVRLNLSSPTNFRTPRVRRLAILLERNLENGAGNK